MPRMHCLVHGDVQGVGFRYFAQRSARNNNLLGWVRNVNDGTVESEVEGDAAALQSYLEDLQRGPAFAYVSRVDVSHEPGDGHYSDFHILPSS